MTSGIFSPMGGGDERSDGEGDAWRASIVAPVLGFVLAAFGVASVSLALFAPADRPLSLLLLVCGGTVVTAACVFSKRLPIWQRALGTSASIGVVCLFSLAGAGFAPNLSLAFGLGAAVLAVLVGGRAAIAYLLVVGAGQLVMGWLVVSGRVVVAPGLTRTDDYRNWLREDIIFLFIMLALAATIRLAVRRVDSAFAEQRAATEERAAQQAELAEAYHLLGRLHRSVESAKEEERRHLARELHDEMGQSLTALKLRLKMAAAAAGGGGAAIGDALGVVDALLVRMRKLSIDLSPPLLDEAGLVPAVRAYLESHAALAAVEVVLDATGLETRLPAELETAAFRVIQESVTNVARHAGARRISVTLACDPARLAISVRDDGVGFTVDETLAGAARGGHLGVAGMRERIRGLGGRFLVTSTPGAGTEVSAVIPVAAPP